MNSLAKKILIVDVEHPLPALGCGSSTRDYEKALILVRMHEKPLGVIETGIPPTGVDADQLASKIWVKFGAQIKAHLAEDHLKTITRLSGEGIPSNPHPLCLQKEDELLATAPFVSVVIATRDRVKSLKETLESIFALNYRNFEVVVVDNAPSSNETEVFVRSLSGKVRYLREEIPGLAIAHNRALAEISAPIVAFTDDDVFVDKNWLKYLLLNFQRDPDVVCVTGMILPHELETLPQLWIEEFGGFSKGCERKVFDNTENMPENPLFPYSAGQFGSGANMAFRVDALKAIGGFDVALGAGTLAKGGDDLASFFDVVANGMRLVYEPAAFLRHKHRRDYSGLARQAYGYGIGLSAFLMKIIWDNPARIFDMLAKTPSGLRHLLAPDSAKNINKEMSYPVDLTRKELLGFCYGPFAYLRSLWHLRTQKEKFPKVI